jgi:cysteine synthase
MVVQEWLPVQILPLLLILAKDIAHNRNAFYADQFNNPSCIKAHFNHTGPEIFRDLPEADVFIASVGSGGTFIGTSKYLKSVNPNIKCIVVEPEKAAILKTGKIDDPKHIIQGTAYGLIPPHWDEALADDFITVSDEEVKGYEKAIILRTGFVCWLFSSCECNCFSKVFAGTGKTIKLSLCFVIRGINTVIK